MVGIHSRNSKRGLRRVIISPRHICSVFFHTSFNCSGAPEGERMTGWAGGLPGGAEHKKGAQEQIPEPLLWGAI